MYNYVIITALAQKFFFALSILVKSQDLEFILASVMQKKGERYIKNGKNAD